MHIGARVLVRALFKQQPHRLSVAVQRGDHQGGPLELHIKRYTYKWLCVWRDMSSVELTARQRPLNYNSRPVFQ